MVENLIEIKLESIDSIELMRRSIWEFASARSYLDGKSRLIGLGSSWRID
jgi:hypothetical protein